ncbi:Cardiolipin synthase A [Pseudomonas sp. 8Z]|uniref:cardiolipin synthase n=1 Tax=Pseudomonas sp. 8Z TaxID=2653166 RepID=UPI0012F2F16F|nr:cardiolipin synthase [Pseudomonas sp. 8Z]VXD04697.1 Cardiolipin synthase A [Pseudomonas sp. 8Z]
MPTDFGIPHLFAYLIAATHVLGVLAAIHAVLTVRTAQGALAWGLSLFFMPYLTLLPYLVFGRSRFDAYVKARRRADKQMHQAVAAQDWRPWVEQAKAAHQSPAYQRLGALPRLSSQPGLSGNHVQLLIDGEATFKAIFEALANAQQVILLQFFIIRDDALGRRLRDVLLERAAAGVQVHVLYDGVGSHALSKTFIASLRQGGVQMHDFPTRAGLLNRFQLNFRNHRKIVVVDGEIGFLGGLNIGIEYLGQKPPLAPWRDTHVQVRGPVVASLQETFAEDWYWACRKLPPLLLPSLQDDPGLLCQMIASGPADAQETASLMFVEAIHAARQRVWLSSPYFVPDEALFAALRLAVMRGVDVRLLLPARPDHRIVYAASSLYAFEALRAGVRIFRYQPGFLHQKALLIDHDACILGSANLDNRSLRLNFEASLLIVDTGFNTQVAAMLEDDFSRSRELVNADRRNLHRLQQLGMRVARLISPIL